MAIESRVGTFTLNGSPGNQTIPLTGSITPVLVLFWAQEVVTVAGSNEIRRFFGAATSSTQRWVRCKSFNAGTNGYSDQQFKLHECIHWNDALTDGTLIAADFVSMNANSFTIDVVAGAAKTIHYLALGGSDIQARADALLLPIIPAFGSAIVSASGLPFKPKATVFVPGLNTGGAFEADNTGGIGFGLSTVDQGALSEALHRDAGFIWAHSKMRTGVCFEHIDVGGNPLLAGEFISNNADGFSVNAINASSSPTTERLVGFVALGGTALVALQALTEPAAPGIQTINTTGFRPSALMLLSQGRAASGNKYVNCKYAFGATSTVHADSASHNQSHLDASTTLPAGVGTGANSFALQTASTTNGVSESQALLSSMDASGFKLDWTKVDSIQSQFLVLAIGAADSALPDVVGKTTFANPDAATPRPLFKDYGGFQHFIVEEREPDPPNTAFIGNPELGHLWQTQPESHTGFQRFPIDPLPVDPNQTIARRTELPTVRPDRNAYGGFQAGPLSAAAVAPAETAVVVKSHVALPPGRASHVPERHFYAGWQKFHPEAVAAPQDTTASVNNTWMALPAGSPRLSRAARFGMAGWFNSDNHLAVASTTTALPPIAKPRQHYEGAQYYFVEPPNFDFAFANKHTLLPFGFFKTVNPDIDYAGVQQPTVGADSIEAKTRVTFDVPQATDRNEYGGFSDFTGNREDLFDQQQERLPVVDLAPTGRMRHTYDGLSDNVALRDETGEMVEYNQVQAVDLPPWARNRHAYDGWMGVPSTEPVEDNEAGFIATDLPPIASLQRGRFSDYTGFTNPAIFENLVQVPVAGFTSTSLPPPGPNSTTTILDYLGANGPPLPGPFVPNTTNIFKPTLRARRR